MYTEKRPLRRLPIIVLIIVAFLLVGCGTSSPNSNWPGLSTDGQNVYVAYGTHILAIDPATQEQLWLFPIEASQAPMFTAPNIDDGQLVIGDYGASGGFFSPQSVISVYKLTDIAGSAPSEQWTNNSSSKGQVVAPALQVDGQVFIGTADNQVLSLDADTGAELWQFTTEHSVWGQPAYRDGVLYITSLDRSVYALEAETGNQIWRTELTGALPSDPILNDELVYVASYDFQLHALDISDGHEVWAADAQDWVWGSPTYDNGIVYFSDIKGNLFAVDGQTGAQIWEQQTQYPIQTSPVVMGDMLFIASEGDRELEEGLLTAYDTADGRQLWQKKTPAPLYTTPIIVDDTLIVALQSEAALLIGFDPVTGSQKWVIPTPQ